MFIIVEKQDVGGRDEVVRLLVATDSVYGGDPFPAFKTKEEAERFINDRGDSFYRKFEALEFRT